MALHVYLNDIHQQLTDEEKDQIIQILQSSKTKIIQNRDDGKDGVSHHFVFDVNDHWISILFDATTVQKIKTMVDHKFTLILPIIVSVIAFFVTWDNWFSDNHWSHYLHITSNFMWITWFIMKHLFLNRTAFKLCIKSFDYWMKVGYVIMAGVSTLIYYTRLEEVCLRDISVIIVCISCLLGTSYISAFDAVNTSKRCTCTARITTFKRTKIKETM
eukprot:850746_1